MKVLVTGGCGYKGAVLVPKLLRDGHKVVVVDTQWFGENLQPNPNLELRKGDIRDPVDMRGIDAVVHLAGIANDPCGELDSKLTWEVNVLGTLFLAEAAVRAGVKRFIFASSASVYGIKGNEPVVEDTELTPVSDYNKTKMCAERVLLSYQDRMDILIARPATVCGLSPRMRLDTVVNMLTAQACSTGEIVAHCGAHGASLMRPNTHIEDITELYCWLLGLIDGEAGSLWGGHGTPPITRIYNAGFENLSVADTAAKIKDHVPAKVSVTEVADKRSYCVDSSRLLAAGFRPKHTVADAIRAIAQAYHRGRLDPKDPRSINLRYMQSQGLVRS